MSSHYEHVLNRVPPSGGTAYIPHSSDLHLHESSSSAQATQAIPYKWKMS